MTTSGKIFLSLLLAMSLVGIAVANDGRVDIPGVGKVSQNQLDAWIRANKAMNKMNGVCLDCYKTGQPTQAKVAPAQPPQVTAKVQPQPQQQVVVEQRQKSTQQQVVQVPQGSTQQPVVVQNQQSVTQQQKVVAQPQQPAPQPAVASQQQQVIQSQVAQVGQPSATPTQQGAVSKPQVAKKPQVREPGLAMQSADHEAFLFAGYHYSIGSDTEGGWVTAKNTKWWGSRNYPFNLGAGLSFDYSVGMTGKGYKWEYFEPGFNLGSYFFGEDDDFLTRFNLAYRIGAHRHNKSGFVPGGELQYSHAYSNRFALIAQVYGKYFAKDSHAGASLVGEYLLDLDWRMKFGLVADVGIGGDSVLVGAGPHVSVEYDNRYVLGLNALVLGPNGPTIGPFVGFKYSSYLAAADKARRGASVEKTGTGLAPTQSLPDGSSVQMKPSKGGFTTWGPNDDDDSQDITLGQQLQQAQDGQR